LKLGYFEHWTGGVQGLVVTKPDAPFGLPMSQDMWLYYFTLVVTIAIYIFSVNLLKSRSGRAFMAIRDNEIAASAMGVDVALYKTLAFGVSAGITGVAGGLGAIAVQFVAPDGYTITLAISLFLGMVVGGVGWLPGSIVGSAFIIFVPNIAEGISKGLSGAVFGVLLFLVIFLVPHGARQVAMVIQHLIKHGLVLEMPLGTRKVLSVAALALAIVSAVYPLTIVIFGTFYVPVISVAAIICATIAALAGDRIFPILVSIVLVGLQLVSPLMWKAGNLGLTISLFLLGVAPLVGMVLNMRASIDVPARRKPA
jgi:hypothetical protein